MKQIVMYSSATCPYCSMAKVLLEKKGVDTVEERRIDLNSAYIDEAIQRSGGRQTVPQIFIDDQHVGGFDDLKALDEKGELDGLLNDE